MKAFMLALFRTVRLWARDVRSRYLRFEEPEAALRGNPNLRGLTPMVNLSRYGASRALECFDYTLRSATPQPLYPSAVATGAPKQNA